MIVYLARDIPQFVMCCVNGKPRSSLLIESTDSMICDKITYMYKNLIIYYCNTLNHETKNLQSYGIEYLLLVKYYGLPPKQLNQMLH